MPKKKVKKSKSKDRAYIELNGTINIVHIENGVKTKVPIDGDIVLKALLSFIEKGIKKLDK